MPGALDPLRVADQGPLCRDRSRRRKPAASSHGLSPSESSVLSIGIYERWRPPRLRAKHRTPGRFKLKGSGPCPAAAGRTPLVHQLPLLQASRFPATTSRVNRGTWRLEGSALTAGCRTVYLSLLAYHLSNQRASLAAKLEDSGQERVCIEISCVSCISWKVGGGRWKHASTCLRRCFTH